MPKTAEPHTPLHMDRFHELINDTPFPDDILENDHPEKNVFRNKAISVIRPSEN